jgi:hypothetical protein
MSFEDIMTTALDYRKYTQKKCNAHYQMCENAKSMHNKLGIPVTIATTIVGTAIFTTIDSTSPNTLIKIGAGLLSLTAVVLSALQTFFNFSDVASQHKDAAASYESVRYQLDLFILRNEKLKNETNLDEPLKILEKIATQMNQIAKKAPNIPDRVYDAVSAKVRISPLLISEIKLESNNAKWHSCLFLFSPFVSIIPRDSKKTDIIQIADIILGAIGFQKNGYDLLSGSKPSKKELCEYIAQKAGLKNLVENTPFHNERFTIWNFQLKK